MSDNEDRKTPYATAQRLVDQGVMTVEQLQAGIQEGAIAPKKINRNYGADQEIFQALQGYVDDLNPQAKEYKFSVMGRKI